jgi:hypothetical protein
MEDHMTTTRRTRTLVLAVLTAAFGLAAACVPTTPPASTTTTTAAATVKTVSNATFEWTVSKEANNGAFAPGQVNYWSAGQSDSTSATYVPSNGNATVLKKNAAGTYVPIGSESAVSWTNRNRDGAGNVVTATNAFFLGQKVRFANGTGTVNTATGVASIQWTGTFSINFYGQYVPFWITNPKLTVNAAGKGTLTATLGGFASDISTPDVRTPLPSTPNVVIAELPDVYASGAVSTGFANAPTAYLNTAITVPADGTPQVAKTSANASFWGSWPQSFVNFQQATGLGSYWYSSGGAADDEKPQDPISVSWTLNP